MTSYPFPIYSGLLEPSHYKRIGSSIWLFLWCVSAITAEKEKEGVTWGIVDENKPMQLTDLADQFEVSEKTVRRWLIALEEHGYLRVTRVSRGLILTVRNSKRFTFKPDENVRSDTSDETKMSDHNEVNGQKCPITHENTTSDQTKMSDHSHLGESDRTKMSDHFSGKDLKSFKDLKDLKDLNNAVRPSSLPRAHTRVDVPDLGSGVPSTESRTEILPFKQIEERFIARRARGIDLSADDIVVIQQLLDDEIPVETILAGIDDAFANYKPRFRNDRVKSMSYCDPVIRERHYRDTARKGVKHHAETDRGSGGLPGSPAAGIGSEQESEGGGGYFGQFAGLISSL